MEKFKLSENFEQQAEIKECGSKNYMDIAEAIDKLNEAEDEIECKGCHEIFEKKDCVCDEKKGWCCKECAGKEDEVTEQEFEALEKEFNDGETEAKKDVNADEKPLTESNYEDVQFDETPEFAKWEDEEELRKKHADELYNDGEYHSYEIHYPVVEDEIAEYCKEHDMPFDNDGRCTAFFGTVPMLIELHDKFFKEYEFTVDGELYLTDEEKEDMIAAKMADHAFDYDYEVSEDDLSDFEGDPFDVDWN